MLAFFDEKAYERRMRLTNASSSVHRLWDHSSKITDSFSNKTLLAVHVSTEMQSRSTVASFRSICVGGAKTDKVIGNIMATYSIFSYL